MAIRCAASPLRKLILTLILITGIAEPVFAQLLSCDTGTDGELSRSIEIHEQQMHQMTMGKFTTGWYWPQQRDPGFRPTNLATVRSSLGVLKYRTNRSSALLFYTHDKNRGRLCGWLIPSTGEIARFQIPLSRDNFLSFRSKIFSALGVASSAEAPDANAIEVISQTLLPEEFVIKLRQWKVDTLLVVPIFDLELISFPFLKIGNSERLMNLASVIVLPGFFAMNAEPRSPRGNRNQSIVVGDPTIPKQFASSYPSLKFAASSAQEVANIYGLKAISRESATSQRVERSVKQGRPTLIYIAAHGVSDEENPLDGGFLLMANGKWLGRDISKLPLMQAQPLVVLSACDTAQGKPFEVGIMGMSRAWYQAGASAVVASLWKVDEKMTGELMTSFAKAALQLPPDKALQAAMGTFSKNAIDPAHWAGFSTFSGLPSR
jgi:hypothetical protein